MPLIQPAAQTRLCGPLDEKISLDSPNQKPDNGRSAEKEKFVCSGTNLSFRTKSHQMRRSRNARKEIDIVSCTEWPCSEARITIYRAIFTGAGGKNLELQVGEGRREGLASAN